MNISKVRSIAQNTLFLILGILPLFFLPTTWVASGPLRLFIVAILATVLCAGVLIVKIKKDYFNFSSHILFVALGAFFVSALLSTIFSNNIFTSLVGRQLNFYSLFGIITSIILAYLLTTFLNDTKSKGKLLLTLFISGVITTVIHLIFICISFIPSLGFFTSNISNTIGSFNDLGLYALFVVLSSILVLQFLGSKKIYKIFALIGLSAGFAILVLVNSTQLFIFAAIASLLFIIRNALRPLEQNSEKRVSYSAIVTLILSVTFLLIGAKTSVFISSWFNVSSVEPRPAFTATIEIAKEVFMQESISHKIFGVGLDRFSTAWLQYKPGIVNQTRYWDIDFRQGYSTILSMIINQGVLGLITLVFLVLVSAYYALRVFLYSGKKKLESFIYVYSAFTLLFFLVAASIYILSSLFLIFVAIAFALLISSMVELEMIKFKKINIDTNPRTSFIYVLSLVILLIGFIYLAYIQISQYSSQFIYERASLQFAKDSDINRAISQIQKSQFIFGSDIHSRTLSDLGLRSINRLLQNTNLNQEQRSMQFQTLLRSTIQSAQNAILIDDRSYTNYLTLLKIYKNMIPLGVTDAKEQSLTLISKIEEITPNNPTLMLEKARVYFLAGENENAIREIQNTLGVKVNYLDAILLLSQVQVNKGEIDAAKESLRAAISLDQFNSNLRLQLGLLYYNQKEFNSAIPYFEDAVILAPNSSNARYLLGLSYYKNNRTDDSLAIFEFLNKQLPENQEIKTIIENIKSGNDPLTNLQATIPESIEEETSEEFGESEVIEE